MTTLTAILCLVLAVYVIAGIGPSHLLIPQDHCVAAVYGVVSGELACAKP